MSIDSATVKKIAKLSRIRIEDSELSGYAQEITGILNWIEQLQEVNTDGVPEMTGAGENTLRMRADKVTDGGIKDDVLKNAPVAEFDCYAVPKVVE